MVLTFCIQMLLKIHDEALANLRCVPTFLCRRGGARGIQKSHTFAGAIEAKRCMAIYLGKCNVLKNIFEIKYLR